MECETKREAESEAGQSAASAELETRGRSKGQLRPSVGAVTGAGVSDGACAFGVAEADTERKVLRVAGLEARNRADDENLPRD